MLENNQQSISLRKPHSSTRVDRVRRIETSERRSLDKVMGTFSRARARTYIRRDNSSIEARARIDARIAASPSTSTSYEPQETTFDDQRRLSLEVEQRSAAVEVIERDASSVSLERVVGIAGEGGDGTSLGRIDEEDLAERGRSVEDDGTTCTICGSVPTSSGAWTACAVRRARRNGRVVLVARGRVYDGSDFIASHPSGPAPILRALGRDNTVDYDMHSVGARRDVWGKFLVGELAPCEGIGGRGQDASAWGEFEPPKSSSCVIM